jgi:hypothetical protein
MADIDMTMLAVQQSTVPSWVQILAALASVAAVALIAYDLLIRSRPVLRVRLRRYMNTSMMEMIVLNRGGRPISVIEVWLEVLLDDGTTRTIAMAKDADCLPFTIPGGGAEHIPFDPLDAVGGSFMMEAFPMGEMWFGYPPVGWRGHEPRWRERIYRRLRGWGEMPRGSSRELKGQRRPPTPDRPIKLK